MPKTAWDWHGKNGQASRKREHFQQVIRLKPNDPEAHNNLGNALLYLRQFAAAAEQFELALKSGPDSAATHYNLSVALMALDRPQEAAVHCQEAVRLKPDYAKAWDGLATSYSRLNRRKEAVAAANEALRLARSQGESELARQIEAWVSSLSKGLVGCSLNRANCLSASRPRLALGPCRAEHL